MNKTAARFIVSSLLIVVTALFLRARVRAEYFPSRLSLPSFPSQVGEWKGSNLPLDKRTLEVLGPGDFLLRDYQSASESDPYIELFIAYFPSQRTGDTIHSPKNCLPGAGWAPIQSKRLEVSVAGHTPFPVTRYLIAKGDSRQLVV